jgi:hypothetical protein
MPPGATCITVAEATRLTLTFRVVTLSVMTASTFMPGLSWSTPTDWPFIWNTKPSGRLYSCTPSASLTTILFPATDSTTPLFTWCVTAVDSVLVAVAPWARTTGLIASDST